MLQLACIMNMVSVWKKAALRVFLCTDTSDPTENERRKLRLDELLNELRIHATTYLVQMEPVKNLLNRPVINEADLSHYQQSFTSQEILNASDIYLKAANQLIKQHSESASLCFLYMPPPPAQKLKSLNNSNNTSLNITGNNMNHSAAVNDILLNNSITSQSNSNLLQEQHQPHDQTTAFIATTSLDSSNENNRRFIKILDMLSDSLPPCVFVNGVSCVTSTHL